MTPDEKFAAMSTAERLYAMKRATMPIDERLQAMDDGVELSCLTCQKPHLGGPNTCNGLVGLHIGCTSCYQRYTDEVLLYHAKLKSAKVRKLFVVVVLLSFKYSC